MSARADAAELRAATSAVVALAQRDFTRFWNAVDLSNPERTRDALLRFAPRLVQVYGDVAATAAANWYDEARAQRVRTQFVAITAPTAAPEVVEGTVRYAAGHLFTDTPDLALPLLTGALQRHVTAAARDTVSSNVARDPARPRFGRVTSGAKTCDFCQMLATRGFVYHDADTAGELGQFHDDCDCQIVAEWS